MDMSPGQQQNIAPSLALADKNHQRYPNQFFDLSQQYMPPTVKELFKWCTFYYYNSSLIGPAVRKMSRYPITDLIVEDSRDSVREMWERILNDNLKIKTKLMGINLDKKVYGNCFVSMHLPFTRILKCKSCGYAAPIKQWDWNYTGNTFRGTCSQCKANDEVIVKDIPYKDIKKVRIIRWSPENITIKYNEYTGNYTYLYTPPKKIRYAIQQEGDKDIVEDMPLIVLKALKENKKIKMNPDNFIHFKNPTLAEQDQGWGKPDIINVLKDLFYFYTLRRAQEAVALEHIVPLDIIYPMPNAQMDPYIHTELGSWRTEIQRMIEKHRRDPNFKGVIPVPVGYGRVGGDGKALMLTPELNYLTQTIVGGIGIPNEFVFGGLNWTGSSVSLRTLENDFIQDRTDLIDFVMWIKEKLKTWMSLPEPESMYFADFRMADDVQRNQQLIGLNAQGKVSNQTMLTELGYDYDQEIKRILEEAHIQNYINDVLTKGQAKSQGEAQLISHNFQTRINELAAQAQMESQKKIEQTFDHDNTGQIQAIVDKLLQMPPQQAGKMLAELKTQMPEVGASVEVAYKQIIEAQEEQMMQQQLLFEQQQQALALGDGSEEGVGVNPQAAPTEEGQNAQAQAADAVTAPPAANPLPDQKPPRRQGGV